MSTAIATAAALAITSAAYWLGSQRFSAPSPLDGSFRRLTNDAGLTTNAVLSADAKFVVYASDRAARTNLDIYVQQVNGDGIVRVTDGAADDYDPDISPDSSLIMFRSDRDSGGIYSVPALGGEARLVIPQGHRPRFSPDGRKVLYWTGPEQPNDVRGSSDTQLWVASVSGGDVVPIGRGCRVYERTAVWSPNGQRILFIGTCGAELAAPVSPEKIFRTGWVSTSDGKSLVQNHDLGEVHGIGVIDQWLDAPSRLLMPVTTGDAISVAAVPISLDGTSVTGKPEKLTFAGGTTSRVSSAANGKFVLSAGTSEPHLWMTSVDENGTSRGSQSQITSGPAGEWNPVLSFDGKKLVYLSLRANLRRLFYMDIASGRAREISTEGFRYDTPVLNRTGTKALCVQYPERASWRDFMFEIPLSGGPSRKIWDQSLWSWIWDWSPDESSVLFQGRTQTDDNHRPELWVLHVPSLQSRILLGGPDEIGAAQFSPDGKWVAFERKSKMNFVARPWRSNIFVAPFRAGEVPARDWIEITDGNMDSTPRFSRDGRLIFFASVRDGFSCIWARKVGPDMRPAGAPFAVIHLHERKHPMRTCPNCPEFSTGPDRLVFTRLELASNLWLFSPDTPDVR